MNAGEPERFGAVCPICAGPGEPRSSLDLAERFGQEGPGVRFGALRCRAEACQAEYPIIDGIPVVRADVRDWLAGTQASVHRRTDLPVGLERMLADTFDPGSREDLDRYYLSVYARDAYPEDGATPGVVRLLDGALGLVPGGIDPGEPVLDLGCAVGRVCFELAQRGHERVAGLDANPALLRCAAGVRDRGIAEYVLKRGGVLYEPKRVACEPVHRERVSLWCADALDPPFAEGTFGCVLALNVLDCVASPMRLLERAGGLLRPGGRLVLTSPYDWSTSATPLEAWVGGHSPRSQHAGDSASVLRSLLNAGSGGVGGLRLVAERDGLEWATRLHDRAELRYSVHALIAERVQ
ncbi:MAG: methyltransferase domain-containing protein [Phycisphaerales bacterium JB040]